MAEPGQIQDHDFFLSVHSKPYNFPTSGSIFSDILIPQFSVINQIFFESICGLNKFFNKEKVLIPRHSAYNTRRSQSDGIFLEVPHFGSIFKSRKHFGLSFAYDAPMIWNDLPDEVRSANSLASFRSKLKSYLFGKAYPP